MLLDWASHFCSFQVHVWDQVCSFMGLSWPEAPCFPPKYPLRANSYPDFWKHKTLLGRTHCQRETTPNQNSNSIPTETSPKLATLIPESEVMRTGGATAGQCSSRYKVLWGLQREQRELGNKRAELWDHTEIIIARDLLLSQVVTALVWQHSTGLCDRLSVPEQRWATAASKFSHNYSFSCFDIHVFDSYPTGGLGAWVSTTELWSN